MVCKDCQASISVAKKTGKGLDTVMCCTMYVDSAGVLLLVVLDGMIFPNGDAKNYTSVPISSL